MLDDSKKLGFYGLAHGHRVHVVDHDPMSLSRGGGLDDVSQVRRRATGGSSDRGSPLGSVPAAAPRAAHAGTPRLVSPSPPVRVPHRPSTPLPRR